VTVANAPTPSFGLTFIRPYAVRILVEHGLGLALGAGSIVLRLMLDSSYPALTPFTLALPAALLATLIGRWTAGLLAVAAATLMGWYYLLPVRGSFVVIDPTDRANLVLFAICGLAVVATGEWVRRLADEVQRRTLHYRALFVGMAEGYALCDAIRDDRGRLADYRVVEVNPSLLGMMGLGLEVLGTGANEGVFGDTTWLALCDGVLRTGIPARFERRGAGLDSWCEVIISRVTNERLALFFVDVTDRRLAVDAQRRRYDELNHRVKNNLSIVNSMLNIQARSAGPGAPALRSAADRIQAIATLHEVLYQRVEQGEIEVSGYLARLCERLRASLLDKSGGITIELQAEPGSMELDEAVPVGLIVNELVTNAVKHAFPDRRGAIRVCYDNGAQRRLVVSDDGKGLPETDRLDERAAGFGKRLIEAMVKQIAAEMDVESGGGSRFTIRLASPAASEPYGGGGDGPAPRASDGGSTGRPIADPLVVQT
jgi:two-component sensor histidine kinase